MPLIVLFLKSKEIKMKHFDYMFYRLAKAYHKWDGHENTTAFIGLGFVQGTLLIDLLLFSWSFFFDRNQMKVYRDQIKIVAIVILAFFMILSYTRYKNMYADLDAKWGNEEKGVRFYKGILVVVALSLPIVILILGAIYR